MQYLNQQETHANIKIFSSAVVLYKSQLLILREIREALTAFTLAAKETPGQQKIPLDKSSVLRALRVRVLSLPTLIESNLQLLNKTISENVLEIWIKKSYPFLECSLNERRYLEEQFMSAYENLDRYDVARLLLYDAVLVHSTSCRTSSCSLFATRQIEI